MGQYYYAVILDVAGIIAGWMPPFLGGCKLVEHAYLHGEFVSSLEWELTPAGKFHRSRVVWAGDYADAEPDAGANLYRLCRQRMDLEIAASIVNADAYPFIVNHTKGVFVNKSKVPKNRNGEQYHPLPLLTCEGNGRGGGDIYDAPPLVGSWARDVISVEKTAPDGFTEVVFDLRPEN